MEAACDAPFGNCGTFFWASSAAQAKQCGSTRCGIAMTADDAREADRTTDGNNVSTDSPTKIKKKRSTRNLLLRGVSALAVLAILYFCLRWDAVNAGGKAWTGFVIGLALLCMREYYRLATAGGAQPFSVLGYVAGVSWLAAQELDLSGALAAYPGISASCLVSILAIVGAMLLQLTRKTNDNALGNISVTLFGIAYCCVMPGLTIHLRYMELAPGGWPMHGIEFAVVCVFVSKVSDVGALLTGSRWGRNKLIPRLSPGKTREGALGGLLFSVFLLQFMVLTAPWMALASLGRLKMLLLSVLLAAGGLAGDLIESSFKRSVSQKDAGGGVPGFGGVLDLTDSLMIATPVMYLFLLVNGATYVQFG